MVSALPLSRTTALLCGGSAGIGYATARALACAGAPRLMLVGRTQARGNVAVQQIQEIAPEADVRYTSADVTTAAGAATAVASAIDAFGSVDLLVNTGGGTGMPELFHRSPLEGLTTGLDGLIRGILLPCRAVLPHMMERRRGSIVNVASDAGKIATPGEAIIGAGSASVTLALCVTLCSHADTRSPPPPPQWPR